MYAFCAATMFWATWLVIQCTLWRSYIQLSRMEQSDIILLTISFLLTGVTFKKALRASNRQNYLSVNSSTLRWCSAYALIMCIFSCLLITLAYFIHRGDFPSKNQDVNAMFYKPQRSSPFNTDPKKLNSTLNKVNGTSLAQVLPRVLYWDGYLLGCAFWLLMVVTTIVFQQDYRIAGSRFLNNDLGFTVPAG